MKELPKYLIQAKDGRLYGYYSDDILRIDLREKRDDCSGLFRLKSGWVVQYEPISIEEMIGG